jgi:hypothetical protein
VARRRTTTLARSGPGRTVGKTNKLPGQRSLKPTTNPIVRPPAGTYDPALDAQMRAAERGFQDLRIDTEQGNERANTNYYQSLGDINQRDTEQSFDFQQQADATDRSFSRSLSDLLRDRARGGEDYGEAIKGLQRNYQRLGNVQAEQATASGQTQGGALAAALRARTENEAIERKPIDTNFQRFTQDSATAEARNREDFALSNADINRRWQRASGDLQRARGDAAQSYQYGVSDRAMQLARGSRELGFYGQDVNAQRLYQATSSGLYNPPAAPAKKKAPKKKR